VYIDLCYIIIVFHISISHFYISYRNVNEISYFKDIANCISKTPFELQPEDGFIKKPKHVAGLITFQLFLYIKGCVRLKTCIHFINYMNENNHGPVIRRAAILFMRCSTETALPSITTDNNR
jgi:hypothetical protein